MSRVVMWLVGLGVLRLHRYAYRVVFRGSECAGAIVLWLPGRKIRSSADVEYVHQLLVSSVDHDAVVMAWDRMPGDDERVYAPTPRPRRPRRADWRTNTATLRLPLPGRKRGDRG